MTFNLDSFDHKLLGEVQRNAQTPQNELGARQLFFSSNSVKHLQTLVSMNRVKVELSAPDAADE